MTTFEIGAPVIVTDPVNYHHTARGTVANPDNLGKVIVALDGGVRVAFRARQLALDTESEAAR